ncbi:hypothetical protein [Roseiterribacter gracilis]|uniref:Uncharacterized protein n=1 Tax=Roseiterribacter gracilis TaxID=2812848 RepID=A0A8S8XD51_9PROT|nr:hypothetical protein TMPK1_14030 [Rhodospirillales bacterium TMPK1]
MKRFLITAALLLPVAAFAAEGPMTGPATWTWNAKESKSSTTPPKAMVLKVTKDDGTKLAWTMTATDAKGKTQKMSWSGEYDGKERPASNGGAAAFSKGSDGAVKIAFKEKDGSTGDESCTVSSDKKKMTCKGTMKGKDGKTADYTDVYDRS